MRLQVIDRRDQSAKGKAIRSLCADFRDETGGRHDIPLGCVAALLSRMWSIAYEHGRDEVVRETKALLPKEGGT